MANQLSWSKKHIPLVLKGTLFSGLIATRLADLNLLSLSNNEGDGYENVIE